MSCPIGIIYSDVAYLANALRSSKMSIQVFIGVIKQLSVRRYKDPLSYDPMTPEESHHNLRRNDFMVLMCVVDPLDDTRWAIRY